MCCQGWTCADFVPGRTLTDETAVGTHSKAHDADMRQTYCTCTMHRRDGPGHDAGALRRRLSRSDQNSQLLVWHYPDTNFAKGEDSEELVKTASHTAHPPLRQCQWQCQCDPHRPSDSLMRSSPTLQHPLSRSHDPCALSNVTGAWGQS
jgi:hypothetical protein